MTIEETIQILSVYHAEGYFDVIRGFNDAIKLGIEALKRLEEYRENYINIGLDFAFQVLPGETVEEK